MAAEHAEQPELVDPSVRMDELRALIAEHERRYYLDDAPTVSDAEFDELIRELRALEAQHPDLVPEDTYTERIGGAVGEQFAPVQHLQPMMSLDNAFGLDELRQWDNRNRACSSTRWPTAARCATSSS